ncbi:MAG: superoxide dismutase family protein [Brevundimonas sp.]|uniref:superoxide dismutase family protein n=1 Tax=Brevundimonas sp. TaxID=1871086 RepID=UPI0027327035|nr:superoxide dismutase family protein [Brevundimonas sp.]MDP3405641.1 superoxide dismutase family protein [Brevundimonas sp.]
MRISALAIAAAALPLAACISVTANDYGPSAPTRAAPGDFGEATLIDGSGTRIGRAILRQGPTGLLIRIEATGLTPGWHGVHIHSVGECAAPFTSAGPHVNHGDPAAPHGLLNAEGPDDGDLPNIYAGADGSINAELFTTRARIAREGPGQWLWDADGSAIVIHANADDHTSQPIGGAGGRIACGVMAAG